MKRDNVQNDLPGELYTIEAHDKIQDNCKHLLATIQAAQNQKQTNTGGLGKLLGAKVIIIFNLGMQDRLINDQARYIRHIAFA